MLQIKEQAWKLQKTRRDINTLIGVTLSQLHFALIWLMAPAISLAFSRLITPVFRLLQTFFYSSWKRPCRNRKIRTLMNFFAKRHSKNSLRSLPIISLGRHLNKQASFFSSFYVSNLVHIIPQVSSLECLITVDQRFRILQYWNRLRSLVLQKNDICLFLFFAIPAQENRDDAESRLINHLMKNYPKKRQILPTNNRSKAVVVTFDMAFSQLVDLVSRVGL